MLKIRFKVLREEQYTVHTAFSGQTAFSGHVFGAEGFRNNLKNFCFQTSKDNCFHGLFFRLKSRD